MTEWFPAVDDALGGFSDLGEESAESAGEAFGGFFGGLMSPVYSWLFKLAVLAALTTITIMVLS